MSGRTALSIAVAVALLGLKFVLRLSRSNSRSSYSQSYNYGGYPSSSSDLDPLRYGAGSGLGSRYAPRGSHEPVVVGSPSVTTAAVPASFRLPPPSAVRDGELVWDAKHAPRAALETRICRGDEAMMKALSQSVATAAAKYGSLVAAEAFGRLAEPCPQTTCEDWRKRLKGGAKGAWRATLATMLSSCGDAADAAWVDSADVPFESWADWYGVTHREQWSKRLADGYRSLASSAKAKDEDRLDGLALTIGLSARDPNAKQAALALHRSLKPGLAKDLLAINMRLSSHSELLDLADRTCALDKHYSAPRCSPRYPEIVLDMFDNLVHLQGEQDYDPTQLGTTGLLHSSSRAKAYNLEDALLVDGALQWVDVENEENALPLADTLVGLSQLAGGMGEVYFEENANESTLTAWMDGRQYVARTSGARDMRAALGLLNALSVGRSSDIRWTLVEPKTRAVMKAVVAAPERALRNARQDYTLELISPDDLDGRAASL